MRLPLRLRPCVRTVRRAFTGPGSLESVAVARDVLCPEEKTEPSPAIFLPGQLDRVIGAPSESSVAAEIEVMTTRQFIHAPAVAYRIRHAALFAGSIYSKSLRYFIDGAARATSSPPVHIEKATLSSTFIGLKYFGHWIKDDCTLRLLCEELGNPPLCVKIPDHRDSAKYANYFMQDWSKSIDSALIDDLVILQDFGQNSLKKRRYEALRSRIAETFGNQQARSLVYLRRGATGAARLVHNEQEILETLERRGFLILDIASASLEDILRQLSQARLVISMEGSNCAHCVAALPSGSGLMLLEPANRFTANQRGWTDSLSIRLGFVVGEAVTASSFGFSISEILQTTDLMLNHV